MSENKIPNEQELWDVLDGKAAPEVKPEPKPTKIGKSHTAYAVWLWELSNIFVFECLRALGHLSPSQRI